MDDKGGKDSLSSFGELSLKWAVVSKDGRSFDETGQSFEPTWTVMVQSRPSSLIFYDHSLLIISAI